MAGFPVRVIDHAREAEGRRNRSVFLGRWGGGGGAGRLKQRCLGGVVLASVYKKSRLPAVAAGTHMFVMVCWKSQARCRMAFGISFPWQVDAAGQLGLRLLEVSAQVRAGKKLAAVRSRIGNLGRVASWRRHSGAMRRTYGVLGKEAEMRLLDFFFKRKKRTRKRHTPRARAALNYPRKSAV